MPPAAVDAHSQATAVHSLRLVRATADTLAGYGLLVDAPEECAIEIVRWPAQGWRPVDPGTGDQGGTVEGVFEFEWCGTTLHGRNNAVNDEYVLGWSELPNAPRAAGDAPNREQVYLHHANYHPDGGQLFFPLDRAPFVAPLAAPGDDAGPEDFVTFWFDGSQGLYIHPGVWHEAVFPVSDRQRFYDKQGKVHARVSIDFPKEFGCYLAAPLTPALGP